MPGSTTETYYLNSCGFTIALSFGPSETAFYREKFISFIREVWGKKGFITPKAKKADFQIIFRSSLERIIAKEKRTKHFFLYAERDFPGRRMIVPYSIGFSVFDLILREVHAFLLERDGFLLHAASVLDKKGILSIFLAPTGGGKSTMASLLAKRGYFYFSDDVLVVRKAGGKWVFYSPPFIEKNRLPTPKMATKAKIFLLIKAKKEGKEIIKDKNSLIKKLIKQLWLADRNVSRSTLGTLMNFIRGNNFYYLKATLNSSKMKEVIDED